MYEIQVCECSENIHGEYYYLLVLALYSSPGIHYCPEQKKKKKKLDGPLGCHDTLFFSS